MRPISPKLRDIIDTDTYYRTCARSDEGDCSGRITIEHALIYGGRQIDELWNLLPICAYHHAVDSYQDSGNLDKQKHEWIALSRCPDLSAISKAVNYPQRLAYLNTIYGSYPH
jgi:hypothetical protein